MLDTHLPFFAGQFSEPSAYRDAHGCDAQRPRLMMTHDQKLVDIRTFSVIAGLSVSTIRRRVRDGGIAALQPGGPGTALRIPADLAKAFRDAGMLQSMTSPEHQRPSKASNRRSTPHWRNKSI
jgi:hypothetical protein